MSKAQVIHQLGAPDAMQWQDWPVPDPAVGLAGDHVEFDDAFVIHAGLSVNLGQMLGLN